LAAELQAARIAAQQSEARHLDPAGGAGAPEEFHHPDEVGDKAVPGTLVQLLRRAQLHDAAVVHDRDALGHAQGFPLVVGDHEET
jgi:hypothetical protein